MTAETASLRAAVAAPRDAVEVVLRRYQAANPRLFGSVARGDAMPDRDIDMLVDLLPDGRNELLRVAGIAEGLREPVGQRGELVVDDVTD